MGIWWPDAVERGAAVEFEGVVDEDGTFWDAFTDKKGRLWLDADESVEVVITGAVVQGYVYDAWVTRDGILKIDIDLD